MNKQTEALNLALEALEDLTICGAEAWSEERPCVRIGRKAITAIKEALAQQSNEQVEPAFWYSAQEDELMTHKIHKEHERLNSYTHKMGKFDLPLYTHPPVPTAQPKEPEQEPVSLDVMIDDEEALALLRDMVVQSNGDLTSIRLVVGGGHSGYGLYVASAEYQEEGAILLVSTTPPQRKPLTDEMIVAGGKALAKLHAESCGLDFDDVWKYYAEDHKADAKAAIEAAHGIKE